MQKGAHGGAVGSASWMWIRSFVLSGVHCWKPA